MQVWSVGHGSSAANAVPSKLHWCRVCVDVQLYSFGKQICSTPPSVGCAVSVGGYVCHVSPLSMFNHGFINLNPTFFHDFYTQNGFEIALLKGCVGDPLSARLFEVPSTGRFDDPPPNASLVVVARRAGDAEIVWPTQSKYLANPDLKVS